MSEEERCDLCGETDFIESYQDTSMMICSFCVAAMEDDDE